MTPVLPDKVMTSGNDCTNAVGMGHMSEDAYRVYMEVVGGGWGSCAVADGADLVDCPIANCSNIPVEALETEYPFMQIEEYGMRRGSAGAGAFRGGLGVHRVYRILDDNVTFNCYSDRHRIAPWGLFGGQPGKVTRVPRRSRRRNHTDPLQSQLPPPKGRPPDHRHRRRRRLRPTRATRPLRRRGGCRQRISDAGGSADDLRLRRHIVGEDLRVLPLGMPRTSSREDLRVLPYDGVGSTYLSNGQVATTWCPLDATLRPGPRQPQPRVRRLAIRLALLPLPGRVPCRLRSRPSLRSVSNRTKQLWFHEYTWHR